MIDIKRILVPTDFSRNSEPAQRYAEELSRAFGADIHLLYVLEHMRAYGMEFGGFAGEGFDPGFDEQDAVKKLGELELEVDSGCTVHRKIRVGSPADVICQYAREQDVDVLVLGTHGRTGLTRLLMGSVAEEVVRRAHCPVLTVRPDGRHFVMPEQQTEATAS